MIEVQWSLPARRPLPSERPTHFAEFRGGWALFVTLDELMDVLFKQRPKPIRCGSIRMRGVRRERLRAEQVEANSRITTAMTST